MSDKPIMLSPGSAVAPQAMIDRYGDALRALQPGVELIAAEDALDESENFCDCGHHRDSHSGGAVVLGRCWAYECTCSGDAQ